MSRWAASKDNFTIDFGGFEHSYYSVQTTQGEEISQHLADCLSVILKEKKENDVRLASLDSAPLQVRVDLRGLF